MYNYFLFLVTWYFLVGLKIPSLYVQALTVAINLPADCLNVSFYKKNQQLFLVLLRNTMINEMVYHLGV